MKTCKHCGGPNSPRNSICDYCGLAFDPDTIPELTAEEKAARKMKADAEAYKNKPLIEFESADGTPTLTVNPENGRPISIDDPIGTAVSVAGLAGVFLGNIVRGGGNSRGEPNNRPGRHGQDRPGRQNMGCMSFGCLLPVILMVILLLVAL